MSTGTGTGVRVERDGAVAEVILSRPHRRNALTRAVMEGLTQAFVALAADPAVGAIVLRGDEGFFCSGLDLNEIGADRPPPRSWPGLHAAIAALDTPVITALQGGAINAGAALALAGDLIVAGQHAWLQIKEAEMGMTPPVNAAWLARRFPPSVGLQLALTCRRFTGPELLRLGVALEVADDNLVPVLAHQLAEQLAAYPRRAASAAKIALRGARGESGGTFLSAVDRARSGSQAFLSAARAD